VKVDPKLGGQWNVPKLGGQWNVPKLGGQWHVPSLVANGMFQAWWPMEWEGKTPFHLFPLFAQQLTSTFNFLTLKFYFTMVLGRYLRLSFIFFDL
jgi:hypothetical protein